MNSPLRRFSVVSLLAAGLLSLSGCQTPRDAKYIESGGASTVVTLDQINIQDWNRAADAMVASLLSSGVLERVPEQPAVLAISRIVNNTQQQVDTDSLTKKIRVALNQSGKVITTTTLGLGGKVEDPLAKESAEMAAMMAGHTNGVSTLGVRNTHGALHWGRSAGWQGEAGDVHLPALAHDGEGRPRRVGRGEADHQAGHPFIGGLVAPGGVRPD